MNNDFIEDKIEEWSRNRMDMSLREWFYYMTADEYHKYVLNGGYYVPHT